MNRIAATFARLRQKNQKALVAYLTAGAPDMASSEALIKRALESGADILELGVPFSDPTADGPVIQEASQRALRAGANLPDILAMAERIRKTNTTAPIVLFSYYNVLFQYGVEKLAETSKRIGIDAWLVVDMPLEERGEIAGVCAQNAIDVIPLLAPTTPPERAARILKGASGFVYYIMVRGVTGARAELPADLVENLETLKGLTDLPIVAGFGVSTPDMARTAAKHADGVVVGSAFVRVMEAAKTPPEGIAQTGALVASLAGALHG